MLKTLPRLPNENLLVGFDASDDACVYRVREDLVLIQTVDFFPPMVDDPYLYGQVAAANALSDIYAMGGAPALALNLLCVPACLPPHMVQKILEGGAQKVAEAGAVIAGGHSIEDDVPKYGLCASGFLHPDAVWSNAGAQLGDVLFLTKPLGSGINNTAAKADMLSAPQLDATIAAMTRLNKYARDAALAAAPGQVHACTDITGFGLAGHAREMAEASGVTLRLQAEALPLLPGAAEMAAMGFVPGGAYRNREYNASAVHIAPQLPLALQDIVFDPQTSGGLLLCVPLGAAKPLAAALLAAGEQAAVIGEVLPRGKTTVEVV